MSIKGSLRQQGRESQKERAFLSNSREREGGTRGAVSKRRMKNTQEMARSHPGGTLTYLPPRYEDDGNVPPPQQPDGGHSGEKAQGVQVPRTIATGLQNSRGKRSHRD